MRIGVITTSYPRYPGDPAGAFVSELNQWIKSRGHQVEVLAAAENLGPCSAKDSWQQSPVTRIPAAPGLFYQGGAPDALSRLQHQWAAIAFSAKMIKAARQKADLWDGIVAHWLMPSALAAVIAAKEKPVWAIAHGGDIHLLKNLGLLKSALSIFDRETVHLHFVSESLQDIVSETSTRGQRLAQHASCTPMGIVAKRYKAIRTLRSAMLKTKKHIVFLGRLVPIKGVDTLIEALPKIKYSDYQLTIAGQGPQKNHLQQMAHRLGLSIRWPGEVSGQQKDELLASADIVVVPSRSYAGRTEGMPIVALEALASGAQLVCTKSGGLGQIPNSICHSFAQDNSDALALILETLLRGQRKACPPGHWIENKYWQNLGPQILPGLS